MPELAQAAVRLELPLLPGVWTASEVMQANAAGYSFLKLFPAVAVGGVNLLKALAAQTAALSLGDSMMAHYLSGDLRQAYLLACEVQTQCELLLQYRGLIIREYEEAKDFDDLLDSLRKK